MSRRNRNLASDLQEIRPHQRQVRRFRCLRVGPCMLGSNRSLSPDLRVRKSQRLLLPLPLIRNRDLVCHLRPVRTRTTHHILPFQEGLVSRLVMIGWHDLIHEASSNSNKRRRRRRHLSKRCLTDHRRHSLVSSRIRHMHRDSRRLGQRCPT